MDDTGMSAGEGYRPVIDAVTATWNEGTDGWYIEASLTYTDEDDDVREGGMVGVTAVVEEETFDGVKLTWTMEAKQTLATRLRGLFGGRR